MRVQKDNHFAIGHSRGAQRDRHEDTTAAGRGLVLKNHKGEPGGYLEDFQHVSRVRDGEEKRKGEKKKQREPIFRDEWLCLHKFRTLCYA